LEWGPGDFIRQVFFVEVFFVDIFFVVIFQRGRWAKAICEVSPGLARRILIRPGAP
jgi:hypothetical protein